MRKVLFLAASFIAFLGTLGSLTAQTPGSQNTAYGDGALGYNPTVYDDTAFGVNAVEYGGNESTGIGAWADANGGAGGGNTAIGSFAAGFGDLGSFQNAGNTGIGASALSVNSGNFNTAIGVYALYSDDQGNPNAVPVSGYCNVAIGVSALQENQVGGCNIAIGVDALVDSTTGSNNIAIGTSAGLLIGAFTPPTCDECTAACCYNPPGPGYSHNIDIGNEGNGNDIGVTRIGTPGTQGRFYAAGIYGIQISDSEPLYTNKDGQLGTVNSSIRFKEDVHDMAGASDKLFRLRPVTYRYKQADPDGSKPVDYGLIAEEVAQVYPDMVVHDSSGEVLTVQYQKLTPMLLNEVQKQHSRLEVQRRQLEAQDNEFETEQKNVQMLEQRLSALEFASPSAKSKTQVAE